MILPISKYERSRPDLVTISKWRQHKLLEYVDEDFIQVHGIHIPSKVWCEMAVPLEMDKVCEWINDFITHLIMYVIIYPCWG